MPGGESRMETRTISSLVDIRRSDLREKEEDFQDFQRAMLNILEDFDEEKHWLDGASYFREA